MRNQPKQEVIVGLFVVIAFVILSLLVFFVSGVYFFKDGYHLKAQFDYVGIINKGAPVRYSGVRVGEVTSIAIVKSGEGAKEMVEITFFVDRGVIIRENFPVSVRGTHIMSEPHIEITPIPGNARILKDGDVIQVGVSPASTDELIRKLEDSADKVDQILTDLTKVFEDEKTRDALKESLDNMNKMLVSMNMVMDGREKDLREMVVRMNSMTLEMTKMVEQINAGKGTLGRLFTDDEIYTNMAELTRELKRHPWKLLRKS